MKAVSLRISKNNMMYIQFHKKIQGLTNPVGKVEEGERPSKAARRELYEETGITKALMVYTGKRHIHIDGVGDVEEYSYDVYSEQEPVNMEPEKHPWVKWMTIEEIKKSGIKTSHCLSELL